MTDNQTIFGAVVGSPQTLFGKRLYFPTANQSFRLSEVSVFSVFRDMPCFAGNVSTLNSAFIAVVSYASFGYTSVISRLCRVNIGHVNYSIADYRQKSSKFAKK